MNEALKIAVEVGGYDCKVAHVYKNPDETYRAVDAGFDAIILDPLFWQALAKALRWSRWTCGNRDCALEFNSSAHKTAIICPKCGAHGALNTVVAKMEKYMRKVFYKETEKFWKELLP
jgi:hypothetical protein